MKRTRNEHRPHDEAARSRRMPALELGLRRALGEPGGDVAEAGSGPGALTTAVAVPLTTEVPSEHRMPADPAPESARRADLLLDRAATRR